MNSNPLPSAFELPTAAIPAEEFDPQAWEQIQAVAEGLKELWPFLPPIVADFARNSLGMIDPSSQTPIAAPAWVSKGVKQLAKAILPTVAAEELRSSDPMVEGKVLGHFLALHAYWRENPGEFAGPLAGNERLNGPLGGIERILLQAVVLGLSKPRSECVQFLDGLHRGYSRTFDLHGRPAGATTSTRVLMVLVFLWRQVGSLPNILAVHKLLTKILGPQLVGEFARTEKLCQRLGLKLAGRGRARRIGQARP